LSTLTSSVPAQTKLDAIVARTLTEIQNVHIQCSCIKSIVQWKSTYNIIM